jgi:hypothetical protein
MNLEEQVRELRNKLKKIEDNLMNSKRLYAWPIIERTFKTEMPIISSEALAKFREQLESTSLGSGPSIENEMNEHTSPKIKRKRKEAFPRRQRVPGTPRGHDMTAPIINFLKTRRNMTASKKEIYEGIKHNYPANILSIPHRRGGKDIPGMTMVEYRVYWAVWVLTVNGKAVGPKRDRTLTVGHIRLIDPTPFSDEQINSLKRNGGRLKGKDENKDDYPS